MKPQRWHILYFVLAAFDILTVSASLALSHYLAGSYETSVSSNRTWTDRAGRYSELSTLATDVNMPGNEVFDNLDVEGSRAARNQALILFNDALASVMTELDTIDPLHAESLDAGLGLVGEAMLKMTAVQDQIFEHFIRNEAAEAGAKMATMDRCNANVGAAISNIGFEVRKIQLGAFAEQADLAASIRRFEFVIAGMIVLMVGAVTVYGHKVSRQVRRADDQLHAFAREATAASHAKSEFLANMSHEIRTPMTAILGFAETVAENVQSQENIDGLATIQRNGKYLLTIINDILDLSKIEADKMDVEIAAHSPCEAVAEVASLMRPRAKVKSLAFNVEYVGDIPETIQTDATRLRQILINLIGNAIKFTQDGGVRLICRLVQDGTSSYFQFDVLDTGIGMTSEQLQRLFQPFTQADSTTTRKFGGTGLGLTISKRFAKLLGGDITITDSDLGVGTRFRATIATGSLDDVKMVVDPQAATVTSSTRISDAPVSDLTGRRVLLAEDGADNQRLISFTLKKAGAEVVITENGKLALGAALSARNEGKAFDCILMDMQMPVMSGYESTAALRDAGYDGPIIALTAHAMATDRQKCIDAGCDDFANKPIDRKGLIDMIASHSGQYRAAA